MKSLKYLIGLLFIGIIACKTSKTAPNQTQLDKSLLWKIEGNDIQPSYIFGTIHLIPEDKFFTTDATKTAFDKTEQLVLELDMDNPNMQMELLKHSMLEDGKNLKNMLSQEDYTKIDTALKEGSGYSLDLFASMKPLILNSLLLTSMTEGKTVSYEEYFMKLAKEKEVEVLGMETVLEQVSVFDRVPYEDQLSDIISLIDEKEKNQNMYNEMVDLFLTQDIEKLYTYTKEQSKESKAIDDQELLVNRNKNWIPKIGEFAKDKPTFFAVGAAHLGGQNGVLNLLRASGYQVTPIVK
ncbi:MAG: TraB/GumN family protein [Flavobacteriaceae bacterium]|nr:TraB/GumN family protein [Flavobacteriaceae bacterium]